MSIDVNQSHQGYDGAGLSRGFLFYAVLIEEFDDAPLITMEAQRRHIDALFSAQRGG